MSHTTPPRTATRRTALAGSRVGGLGIAMVILVALTASLVVPLTVGAAPNTNKPVVLTVDDTFPAPNLTRRCGFAVTAHVFGTLTVKVLRNGVELDKVRYRHVFSGPGGSFSVNHVENVMLATTTSPDGTRVETITATGTLLYHAVLPGHGSIANNSGREVWQITYAYDEALGGYAEVDFQVPFDSGPNDDLTDADYALICAELA